MNPVYPKKSLGQNFLKDPNVSRKIVDCLDIQDGDSILEIGPGRGALTGFLLEKTDCVLALEKDWHLCTGLKKKYPDLGLINADALKFVWEALDGKPDLKIVGNLPYNVASPIIWELVSCLYSFQSALFMLQKEVAQRICSGPGKRTYGALTAWVQNFAQPVYRFEVSPEVFSPRPKVDSAIVQLYPLKQASKPDKDTLARCIKLVFSWKRKQLKKILKNYKSEQLAAWFERNALRPESRPEEVPARAFVELSEIILR